MMTKRPKIGLIRPSRLSSGALVIAASAALAVSASPAPAFASVRPTPASGTPQLAPTGQTEQIRQLVQCGGTMYAVGTFSAISQSGQTFRRNNIFSFSATAPFTVTGWNPNVSGEVNTIAFNGTNCAIAYIGGKFRTVHGFAVNDIAAVRTSNGSVVRSFAHSANGQVETIAAHGGHLLVGGYFTHINRSRRLYMASLNPKTGLPGGYLALNIHGNIKFCNSTHTLCTPVNPTRVYNQQISHSGRYDLVEGDFTSAGGQNRQQIFMLNLGGTRGTVTKWTSSLFNQHCWYSDPFYLRSAAWSPSDGTVYTAATGYKPANWNGSFPMTGLCDSAAAFPATQGAVRPRWINYTGCDSLYSTVADNSTAYFGGHERWSQNPNGCNFQGPGAIAAPGMEGLSPADGHLIFNPGLSRGMGADDMIITHAGLWIADDNLGGVDTCGGQAGHAGLCFLPY